MRAQRFDCAYCGHKVSSERGYAITDGQHQRGGVFICPDCSAPTFFAAQSNTQNPGVPFGRSVAHLPNDVASLYEEARICTSHSCYTAAVLLLRKLLMNIAVTQGADVGLPFVKYVDHLSQQGYVPPNGRQWVDHIRKKGNEATHEIVEMTESDARDLVTFMEMLLRFIYEFPNSIPPV